MILIYIPPVSTALVRIFPLAEKGGEARVSIKAQLQNPERPQWNDRPGEEMVNPAGTTVQSASRINDAWQGFEFLDLPNVSAPLPSSPEPPNLHHSGIARASPLDDDISEMQIGVPYFEFEDQGAFKLSMRATFEKHHREDMGER